MSKAKIAPTPASSETTLGDGDNMLVCYVLMRTDVPDYGSGKATGQSHHAGTHMAINVMKDGTDEERDILAKWADQAGGFGTCISKEVNYRDMRRALNHANVLGLIHGTVHDPEFPVRDGDTIQTLPVDTCGYILGTIAECSSMVSRFGLLPSPEF